MGKFAAYLNAALALAWLALFFTNDALFVSHEVDLSDHLRGDAFAMAWAGSAICSRLYISSSASACREVVAARKLTRAPLPGLLYFLQK